MYRVGIYMRVSTDRQAQEGDSIPAQKKALVDYVNGRDDYVLSGTYIDDGISGQKFEQRDALQQMLSDVREGKLDIILFTKLDRFFRSVRHYATTQQILDDCKVAWKAIWEPNYDTTTPMGQLMVNQMMSFAQFEAQNTSARIKQVFQYKREKGEVCSGMVPYGYKIENKHLVPNENADNVEDIFSFFSRCGNLAETVRYAQSRYGCIRTSRMLKMFLTNRKYIGECREVANFCPPLVSRELFDDVQRKLIMGGRQPSKRIYIFSGLIRCSECGGKMTSYCAKDILYYRCRKHYGPLKTCPNTVHLSQNGIEKYLLSSITNLIEKDMASYKAEEKKDVAKLRASLNKRLERLKTLYIDGDLEIDEYKARKADLLEQLDALEEEEEPRDYTELEKLLEMDIEPLYNEFTDQERQYFWRSVIKEIQCDKLRNYKVVFF